MVLQIDFDILRHRIVSLLSFKTLSKWQMKWLRRVTKDDIVVRSLLLRFPRKKSSLNQRSLRSQESNESLPVCVFSSLSSLCDADVC